MSVSVAIPTLDGAAELERTLRAVRDQTVPAEVVVLDSSSSDDTVAVAQRYGARVESIARAAFGHGSARNRLMAMATGERVALITQDAEPGGPGWLAALLDGFDAAADVALTYGPYAPRADTPIATAREYAAFFAAMGSADGGPRVWRSGDVAAGAAAAAFASSANLCLSRRAWTRTPFRDVAYAEDQWLARDVLAAGGAECFVPAAAVIHAHAYSPWGRLRRSFDEFRALHQLYDWTAPASPRVLLGTVRVEVRRDRAYAARLGRDPDAETGASVGHHLARGLGAALGSRADRLPAGVRRRLSAEGRP